jgi:ABC-type sulfate transport system permease component
VLIYNQIESDNPTGAAAVSVLLLVIALAVVLALRALGRRSARDGS